MHAYIGTPGYFINTELRAGSQHSQKGTPGFLRETIALCRQVTDEPLLFRMDSGREGFLVWDGKTILQKHHVPARREDRLYWQRLAGYFI